MTMNRSLILLLALTFALPAQAEIYKWTDASGKSHFSGSKPALSASIENRADLEAKSPQPMPVANKPTDTAAVPQVDLYITNWCPYCKKAMAFLRKNNIAFNTYDIEQDLDAAARKKTLDPGYSGIPLAVINGVPLRGFSESAYQQALTKN
ncbi:MAG: glutaredoxin domain-containing protein [Methylobacter sp.]|uniref:glutaredoxin domain-containing protein n=1 Tax=Methylobacter sp. TaxID=2051955 RepID=UPI0027306D4C|nr:glutaredoxin domain-containing protein [Methylobacter sp.]MDP1665546.1 glutaredoxin domain-containing protein [Methylobacter sp.]